MHRFHKGSEKPSSEIRDAKYLFSEFDISHTLLTTRISTANHIVLRIDFLASFRSCLICFLSISICRWPDVFLFHAVLPNKFKMSHCVADLIFSFFVWSARIIGQSILPKYLASLSRYHPEIKGQSPFPLIPQPSTPSSGDFDRFISFSNRTLHSSSSIDRPFLCS